jgi:hypothetical protein
MDVVKGIDFLSDYLLEIPPILGDVRRSSSLPFVLLLLSLDVIHPSFPPFVTKHIEDSF